VFLECESWSERSGDPALRGFRNSLKLRVIVLALISPCEKPHQQAGALQLEHSRVLFNISFSLTRGFLKTASFNNVHLKANTPM